MSKKEIKPKFQIYDRVYVPGITNFFGTIVDIIEEEYGYLYKVKRDGYDNFYYKTEGNLYSV